MTTITIRPGDTLTSLARQHNTTVRSLTEENNIRDPNQITAGTLLRIPGSTDEFIPSNTEGSLENTRRTTLSTENEFTDTPSRTSSATGFSAAQFPSGRQPDAHVDVPFMSQWKQPRPSEACLRTAQLMAEKAGAKDAGPGKTLWLNPSRVGRQAPPQELRSYMDGQLNAGKPVIAGVDRPGGRNTNHDRKTDHWVVVTGRGQDEQGRTYYSFHDPGARTASGGSDTHPNNRLYLDESTGQLSRPAGSNVSRYSLTAVRTNQNSPGLDAPVAPLGTAER